jgi:pimeloyl-ACP methyl ester carboxylesterase
MPNPEVRYCTTDDGVRIAYVRFGRGIPLIHVPTIPWSHIELEWHVAEWRAWYERVSRMAEIIRYDCRGSGLSDRVVSDYSLDAHVRDIEAVARAAKLKKYVPFVVLHSAPVLIRYAALHPDEVSHLILWCSYAAAPQYTASKESQAFLNPGDQDWEIYIESLAHTRLGWSAGAPARRFARFLRHCVSQHGAHELIRVARLFDATPFLGQVKCPTLVLHREGLTWPSLDAAKRLVSGIPNAKLETIPGGSIMPWLDEVDPVITAIQRFLGIEENRRDPLVDDPRSHAFRTVLFTDIVGHTEMMSRLGDDKGRDVLREHERITREALSAYGGAEIKTMGDGFMASFASVTKAVECAIALQRAFVARQGGESLDIRVG